MEIIWAKDKFKRNTIKTRKNKMTNPKIINNNCNLYKSCKYKKNFHYYINTEEVIGTDELVMQKRFLNRKNDYESDSEINEGQTLSST